MEDAAPVESSPAPPAGAEAEGLSKVQISFYFSLNPKGSGTEEGDPPAAHQCPHCKQTMNGEHADAHTCVKEEPCEIRLLCRKDAAAQTSPIPVRSPSPLPDASSGSERHSPGPYVCAHCQRQFKLRLMFKVHRCAPGPRDDPATNGQHAGPAPDCSDAGAHQAPSEAEPTRSTQTTAECEAPSTIPPITIVSTVSLADKGLSHDADASGRQSSPPSSDRELTESLEMNESLPLLGDSENLGAFGSSSDSDSDQMLMSCTRCQHTFFTRDQLMVHMNAAHRDPGAAQRHSATEAPTTSTAARPPSNGIPQNTKGIDYNAAGLLEGRADRHCRTCLTTFGTSSAFEHHKTMCNRVFSFPDKSYGTRRDPGEPVIAASYSVSTTTPGGSTESDTDSTETASSMECHGATRGPLLREQMESSRVTGGIHAAHSSDSGVVSETAVQSGESVRMEPDPHCEVTSTSAEPEFPRPIAIKRERQEAAAGGARVSPAQVPVKEEPPSADEDDSEPMALLEAQVSMQVDPWVAVKAPPSPPPRRRRRRRRGPPLTEHWARRLKAQAKALKAPPLPRLPPVGGVAGVRRRPLSAVEHAQLHQLTSCPVVTLERLDAASCERVQCDSCELRFVCEERLAHHRVRAHSHACAVCRALFPSRARLAKHALGHRQAMRTLLGLPGGSAGAGAGASLLLVGRPPGDIDRYLEPPPAPPAPPLPRTLH